MIPLTDDVLVKIGRITAGVTIVGSLVSLVGSATVIAIPELYEAWIVHNNLAPASLAVLGWILIQAQPRSRLVWGLIMAGLLNAINGAASTVVALTVEELANPKARPTEPLSPTDLSVLEAVAYNLSVWLWIPPVALLGTFALLWFPDGCVPGRRWRVVEMMAFFGVTVVTAVVGWQTRPFGDYRYPAVTMVDDAHWLERALLLLGLVVLMVSVLLSVASLVVRYRTSRGTARRQLRWIVWAAGTMAGLGASAAVFDLTIGSTTMATFRAATLIGLVLFFTGYGLAIRREQLFDIDIVLSRTLLIGFLTLFITGVYVGIVFGIGTVIGRSGGGDRGLSLLATIAVAFAFQPVRFRLEQLANRLVYGTRATPYEVLSNLTGQLADAENLGGLLDRMTERLAAGTVAESATLWRTSEFGFEPAATWPADQTAEIITELPGNSVEIQRAGTVLGALSVTKKRGDELSPTEQRLMVDLAGSAALVMDKARLDTALEDQARRLFESRRRQVDAQDAERKRLEQHLDVTTRRQLLRLGKHIAAAADHADRDGIDAVAQQLSALRQDAKLAADEVKSLARGIFPPLLESEGLVHAVTSLADGLPLPITVVGQHNEEVTVDGSEPSMEDQAALYFSIAEALTNAVKHAEASRATVEITYSREVIAFVVADDGHGFDPTDPRGLSTGLSGIADRLEAIGGHLSIESEPGCGTRIAGAVDQSVATDIPMAASVGA